MIECAVEARFRHFLIISLDRCFPVQAAAVRAPQTIGLAGSEEQQESSRTDDMTKVCARVRRSSVECYCVVRVHAHDPDLRRKAPFLHGNKIHLGA